METLSTFSEQVLIFICLSFLLKELVNLTSKSVLRVANMMPMHMYPKIEDPITIAAIEKSNNGPWHDLTDVSYNTCLICARANLGVAESTP